MKQIRRQKNLPYTIVPLYQLSVFCFLVRSCTVVVALGAFLFLIIGFLKATTHSKDITAAIVSLVLVHAL